MFDSCDSNSLTDCCVCVYDCRLVEVNGEPVVNSTHQELMDVLRQGPRAEIVVLRQPPPSPSYQQHTSSRDTTQTVCPERDEVAMETPPRRKVMAIWWSLMKHRMRTVSVFDRSSWTSKFILSIKCSCCCQLNFSWKCHMVIFLCFSVLVWLFSPFKMSPCVQNILVDRNVWYMLSQCMCRTKRMENIFLQGKEKKTKNTKSTLTSFFSVWVASWLTSHLRHEGKWKGKRRKKSKRQIELCSTGYVISFSFLASNRIIPEGRTMSPWLGLCVLHLF